MNSDRGCSGKGVWSESTACMVQRCVVRVWLLRSSEFPLFQTFLPVLEAWPCSRTNKDLSVGELIYGVFNTIICVL